MLFNIIPTTPILKESKPSAEEAAHFKLQTQAKKSLVNNNNSIYLYWYRELNMNRPNWVSRIYFEIK